MSGALTRRRVSSLPETNRITGFAFNESGDAYTSIQKTKDSNVETGLYQLGCDADPGAQAKWLPVEGTIVQASQVNPVLRVSGSSGTSLLYTRGLNSRVLWSEIAPVAQSAVAESTASQ